MRVVAARPTFGPELARGAVAGLVLGLVLAVVLALTGFPEWGQVVWGFAVIAGGLLLLLGFALRLIAHAMWAYLTRNTAPERQTPTPDYMVSPTGFGLLGGAAAAALALVLGLAHLVGGDSPNPF